MFYLVNKVYMIFSERNEVLDFKVLFNNRSKYVILQLIYFCN